MQRDDRVAAGHQAERLPVRGPSGLGQQALEAVDHDVADVMNGRCGMAFAAQVLDPGGLRHEQAARDGVGGDPVDLLRHAAIAAAQPGLHVVDRDPELGPDEGGGQCRVHVAHHDQPVHRAAHQVRLQALHDPPGLDGVRARSHAEVDVRGRDPEIAEQRATHGLVVVLPGVDEGGLQALLRGKGAQQGGGLHEVGPGSGHEDDAAPGFVAFSGAR